MSENVFENGKGFRIPLNPKPSLDGKGTDDIYRYDSPERDRMVESIRKLSAGELKVLSEYLDFDPKASISRRRLENYLEELDKRYGFTGNNSLKYFYEYNQGNALYNEDAIIRFQFHVGAAKRAKQASDQLKIHYERLQGDLRDGKTVYMSHTNPCPKFDKSKSPYERVREIWEKKLFTVEQLTRETMPAKLYANILVKADLSFLPLDLQVEVKELLLSAHLGEVENTGQFERTSYPNGTLAPINIPNISNQLTNVTEQERRDILNDSWTIANPPSDVQSMMTRTLVDGNIFNSWPTLENGRVVYPKDIDGGAELDPEYKNLILQNFILENEGAILEFQKMINEFIDLNPDEQQRQINSGGLFSTEAKKFITSSLMSLLYIAEFVKIEEMVRKGEGLDGHTPHTISRIQGVIEIIANTYKSLYYLYNGEYGKAGKQIAIGIIAGVFEFGLPSTLVQGLTRLFPGIATALETVGIGGAAGGYVGLTIASFQFANELAKGNERKRFEKEFPSIMDKLLDLERRMIEDECCTTIHPNLYRKSKGQLSILMTPDGFIPFETEYIRTNQGGGSTINSISPETGRSTTVQAGPCDSNGQIPIRIKNRVIKVLTAEEQAFLDQDKESQSGSSLDTQSSEPWEKPAVYIVDPRTDPDPCATKRNRRRNEVSPGPDEGGSDPSESLRQLDTSPVGYHTPHWGETQERNLQTAIAQYNRSYNVDVFNFKINSAKCKTGEIPSVVPGGGGAPDRDGFSPIAGQSGMPGGFHRVGISRIVDISIEEDFSSAATDSTTMGGSGGKNWVATWESYTRETGFSTGAGGAGSGTKLRGITSFGYNPLNPPKPIEPV
jgi:hypothetical protein